MYSCVFIGVNYKSSEETIEWAKNIFELYNKCNILVVLIDNSNNEVDLRLEEALKKINKNIVYIDTKSNLGYLPGADVGINYLRDNDIDSSYIIVCNVDIRFKSPHMIDTLLKKCDRSVGVYSPRIIGDGVELNPYRISKLTKCQMRNRILYFKYPFFQKFIDCFRKLKRIIKNSNNKSYPAGTEMYMTYGACFIFSKEYFTRGGNIQTPLFLYIEEPYVAEMCIKLGLKTVFLPDIVIADIGHVSTGQLTSKRQNEILLEAARFVYENYIH